MADEGDILLNVVLRGADTVQKQLADIGKAGQSALNALGSSPSTAAAPALAPTAAAPLSPAARAGAAPVDVNIRSVGPGGAGGAAIRSLPTYPTGSPTSNVPTGQATIGGAAQVFAHDEAGGIKPEIVNKLGEHLKKVGEVGKSAFEGLSKAATSFFEAIEGASAGRAIEGVEGLVGTISGLGRSLGPVGAAAASGLGWVTGIAAAAAGADAALAALDVHFAEEARELKDLSEIGNVSVREMYGLTEAFKSVGGNAAEFGLIFRSVSNAIQAEADAIARNIRDAADVAQKNLLAISSAQEALAKAQIEHGAAPRRTREAELGVADALRAQEQAQNATLTAAIGVSDALANQERAAFAVRDAVRSVAQAQDEVKNSATGVAEAQVSLAEAIYQRDLAYGSHRNRAVERQFQRERADLAVANAQAGLVSAQRRQEEAPEKLAKAMIGLEQSTHAQTQANIAVREAQLQLAAAGEAAEKASIASADASDTLTKAKLDEAAATRDVQAAMIAVSDAMRAASDARYRDVGLVAANLSGRATPGQMLSSLAQKVDPDTLRKAVIQLSEVRPGEVVPQPEAVLQKLNEIAFKLGPGALQQALISAILPRVTPEVRTLIGRSPELNREEIEKARSSFGADVAERAIEPAEKLLRSLNKFTSELDTTGLQTLIKTGGSISTQFTTLSGIIERINTSFEKFATGLISVSSGLIGLAATLLVFKIGRGLTSALGGEAGGLLIGKGAPTAAEAAVGAGVGGGTKSVAAAAEETLILRPTFGAQPRVAGQFATEAHRTGIDAVTEALASKAAPAAAEAATTPGFLSRAASLAAPALQSLAIGGNFMTLASLADVGDQVALNNPKVRKQIEEDDARTRANFEHLGLLGGTWQNLKEGWGFGGAPDKAAQADPTTPAGKVKSGADTLDASSATFKEASDQFSKSVQEFHSALSKGGFPITVPSHADGGHIRGAGTATSDSIPAYLSDGEYVVNAASVKGWGKSFFDTVNTFTDPSSVPHFDAGGAVQNTLVDQMLRDMRDNLASWAKAGAGADSWVSESKNRLADIVSQRPGDHALEDDIRIGQQGLADAIASGPGASATSSQRELADLIGQPMDSSVIADVKASQEDLGAKIHAAGGGHIRFLAGGGDLFNLPGTTGVGLGTTPDIGQLQSFAQKFIAFNLGSFSPAGTMSGPAGVARQNALNFLLQGLQPGALQKLMASSGLGLAGMGGSSPFALGGIAHFAAGGMAGADRISLPAMPSANPPMRYAAGGDVPGGQRAMLDIRTDAGTFQASVSKDTMRDIAASALKSRLTTSGVKPSWYK